MNKELILALRATEWSASDLADALRRGEENPDARRDLVTALSTLLPLLTDGAQVVMSPRDCIQAPVPLGPPDPATTRHLVVAVDAEDGTGRGRAGEPTPPS